MVPHRELIPAVVENADEVVACTTQKNCWSVRCLVVTWLIYLQASLTAVHGIDKGSINEVVDQDCRPRLLTARHFPVENLRQERPIENDFIAQ